MASEQSNILKRTEQITKWFESETDKASKVIKEADKIKFSKEIQFLSACNTNDWEEIGRLLSEGININSTQDDGLTSLHQACIDDDERLVKYLIENGADIDAQDKEGWTPLFAAISCNYLPITKYLVSCGARLDMVSFDGELPLDQSNNETIAAYIKGEMTKRHLDPEEIRSRERNMILNDIEFMKKTADFSPFTLVDNGGSLLHIAASKDYMDVLERLLEIINPPLLNHTDNDGWNALHVAAHFGNRKACVLLVNADIDFDKVTLSNQTVLEVSDDDVKPYIREEIRKARFRRQERASVKRPAESPHAEYQPSETKIICPDKKSPSPIDNQPQQQRNQQYINGDKDVMPTKDPPNRSLSDSQKSLSTFNENVDPVSLADTDLKSNEKPSTTNAETCPSNSLANSNSQAQELVPSLPSENSKPTPMPDESQTTVIDTKSPKVLVPVLPLSKVAESESQRKDKARHVRSTRRSTQGVTAEDIDEAKKLMSVEKPESPATVNITKTSDSSKYNHKDDLNNSVKSISNESQLNSDQSPNNLVTQITDSPELSISKPSTESQEPVDKKEKTVSHVVNKRRTRERPPTGTVELKDIEAAHKELLELSEPTQFLEAPVQKDPEMDYRALYENELKEREKLQRSLTRVRRELDQSEDKVKSLQNNHVLPKSQSSTIIQSAFDLKEMEKLRDDNKKMKEANSALIRVISRLSHPSSKSVSGGAN